MNPVLRSGRPRSRGGFTLVEMLIVIAIIGILAAGLVVAVTNVLDRTRIKKADAAVKSILAALESYKADFERYPPIFSGANPQARELRPNTPSNESASLRIGGFSYGAAGYAGNGPSERMRRNQTLRIFLEVKWPGKNNSPYIARDVDKATVDPAILPLYVDPWQQPYVINCPGANHGFDKDDSGQYIPKRLDTSAQGRETNWKYDIYSFGPDNVDSYDYGSHDNSTRAEGTHGDDIGTFGMNQ